MYRCVLVCVGRCVVDGFLVCGCAVRDCVTTVRVCVCAGGEGVQCLN